ncbi:MAG: S8 family peptidase [Flavobacteriia bacterium]|jgi:minor extracellular serine protease Vpr
MMKYFILSFFSLSFSLLFAQTNYSNVTRIDLQNLEKSYLNAKGNPEIINQISNQFPVNKINGKYFVSVLAETNQSFSKIQLENLGVLVGGKINSIVSLKVPLDNLNQIYTLPGINFIEITGKIRPTLDKAIKDIRADSVQKGINLPEAYTGKNVYIGICDWGFDYTHPNFYDTLLTQTRIAAAWDQYKTSGPAPSAFSYGTEFDTETELLNAQSDTSNIYSYAYHGSHVAGICGGSGGGTAYRGVAFEAQYLMATFLIDAGSVLDAYEWMYQKAIQDGKRLVINQSWGLHHIGNLDGTSLLSQAIDSYSALGVVFVSSAGNNGNVNFHLSKTFNNDELKSKIDFYDYTANQYMYGQSLTLWGEPTKEFSTSIQVYNSSNLLLVESPLYSTATTSNYIDSMLVTGNDTIFFNVSCENANPQNSRPHTRFRVKNTNTALRIVMRVKATDGLVHCWNVTELTTDVGNWGMPFTNIGSGTIGGNTQYGISEPACTNSTIAVAAYATQYPQGNGSLGGAIANFSSFGPTLDERVKPDISAPGVNIGSSFSSFTDASFSPVATVDFNGRTYPFAKISGTSMSGPMVTGIVALILDANPYLSAEQIKMIIKETARTDNFTGVIPAEGSVRWGAGKINAYAAVQMALTFLGTEELKSNSIFTISPNPSCDFIILDFPQEIKINSMKIFDLAGKEFQVKYINNQINISNLPTGMYIIQVQAEGRIYQQKFVKD